MRRVKLNFKWLVVLIGFIAVVVSPSHAVSLVDNFDIKVGTDNAFLDGEGTGYYDDGRWFYYPISNWWTQWFYNAPYDPSSKTVIDISFDVTYTNPSYPPVVKVAYNWTTPEWSMLGKDHPPLPDDVPDSVTEDEYIQRWAFANISIPPYPDPTHVEEHFEINYNAEWVSVEVVGSNASIVNGTINLGKTTPEGLDFGDAPDSLGTPEYPTLLANDGARHVIGGPWLGDSADQPDTEADGQPDLALGDDDNGKDDENGVNIPPLVRGQDILITVDVNGGGGNVDAWIDFDGDQSWETGEKIISEILSDGLHTIAVKVPSDAKIGQSFARFRISTLGGLAPNGEAPDGEVEDYEVEITQLPSNVKWVQLPDLTQYGIDIRLDKPRVMGDDFVCKSTDLLTGVHLWGSWKNDIKGQINEINLSIHEDDPPGPGGTEPNNTYSKAEPEALWTMQFDEGEFTETLYQIVPTGEYWWDPYFVELIPGGDTEVWQIDIDIDPDDAFLQQGSSGSPVIYWLVVEVDTSGGQFGWKSRQWMYQSNGPAVRTHVLDLPLHWWIVRFPADHPLQYRLMDLSFMLTSGEGPSVSNDNCADAEPIGNVTNKAFDTTEATFDGPGHCTHAPNIWYCYTATCTGDVTVSLCGSSYDTMLAVYDGCGCYPSQSDLIECNDDYCGWQSEITFNATAGNHYLIEIGGYGNESGQGVLNISCEAEGPSNDDCDDAKSIGEVTDMSFDTTSATFDGPGHCTHAPNLWYCYTATCTGEATVSLCGSSYDTMLAVYDGCGCYPSQSDLIECNDDYCGWQSEITFNATAGENYLIEVGGYGSETGQGILNISCEPMQIEEFDFGDAPQAPYLTTLSANGARHLLPSVPQMYLGAGVDVDLDGQPNSTATGDDDDGNDDEDGVTFTSQLVPGKTASVKVLASKTGYLDAWVDFDGNGKWIDAGDKIFSSQLLSAGLNSLSFSVPSTATPDITTFARFRFSTVGGLNYYGLAQDGEVEDYSVTIGYKPEPAVEHIKWSQPPIEIDPKSETPVFCGWDEPSYFSYTGGACVVIENFEDGDIAEYSVPSGDTHSVTTAAAHDGAYGLEDSNPDSSAKWIYRDDSDVHVAQGDTISYWIKLLDDEALGRAYCGFGATASGTYCIIAAANSNTFSIQKNVGYGYNTIGSVSQYWTPNKWYRLEVEWGIGGDIVGNLYDSDGTTLLNTVTASSDTYTSGGIAFRGFEHVYVDTVERCKPSAVQISITSASSMMSSAQAKVVEPRDPDDAIGWDSDNEAYIFDDDDVDENDTAPSISSSAVKKTAKKVSTEVSDLNGTSSAGAGVYAKQIRATKLASGNKTLVIETRMGISDSILDILDSLGHSYDFISGDSFSGIDFSPYTTIILGMDGGQTDEADMDHLADYIETGAKLILLGGTNYSSFAQGLNDNFIRINTAVRSWRKVSGSPDIKVVNSNDPLASGIPANYNFTNDNATYYMARINDSTAKTIIENGDGYPCLVTKSVDAGDLIFFINSPNEDYWSDSGDLEILKTILENALSISNVTGQVVADDFRCLGNIPISSIHWWGSYQGWDGAEPPENQPVAWQIAFWSNTSADLEGAESFSRPNTLLWQVEVAADNVSEEKVGSDQFPQRPSDTCFKYYIQLDPEEYFWQDPNDGDIFWISISAVYSGAAPGSYVWGWKTRPEPWMDCAVRFSLDGTISPGKVLDPLKITPIKDSTLCGEPQCYDMAFELDTDPEYLKCEQPFTGLRQWQHYEDEESVGINTTTTEEVIKHVQEAHLSSLAVDVDATKTSTGGTGTWPTQILADDFPCTTTGPLTNIRIWGAWYSDVLPDGDPESATFTLSIYENITASESTTGYSTPGSLLWRKDFKKGEFTVSEYEDYLYSRWMVPCTVPPYYQSVVDKTCWQYDFNIDPSVAFYQQGSSGKEKVYWLAVQVRPETQSTGQIRFGWKSTRSSSGWNDVAVWAQGSYPAPYDWSTLKNPRTSARIDLAFAIGAGQGAKELQISRLVADDWLCEQRDPITALAWWGSYIEYEIGACQCQQQPSPTKPGYFLLSIWTDESYPMSALSHPGQKIWEYKAYVYDEVMVGYDKHPLSSGTDSREPVFRYSVRLPEEDWFCQDDVGEVYWFSVVAVYDESTAIDYPWGWTNHPHNYGNDAVSGYQDTESQPSVWTWQQLLNQVGGSQDMSFVLFSESEDCIVY
jgi:hypothetical protein